MFESWLVVALALGLGGFVKGATGMGLPMVAIPLLATAFDLPSALSMLVAPVIVTNLWQAWEFRSHRVATPFLGLMLAFGFVGVLAGTYLLTSLPRDGVSLLLGAVLVTFVALRITRPPPPIGVQLGRLLAPAVGFLSGVLQGTTGLASPVSLPYLLAMRLEREAYLFAVSSIFLLFAATQGISLWFVGLMRPDALLAGVAGLVPIAVLMPIGNALGRAMNRRAFDVVTLSLLTIMAATLIAPTLLAYFY